MRLAPILGLLALLALVPGALGCHWGTDTAQSGQSFTAQSAPSAHPSAAVVALFVVVPLAVVGVVVAAGVLRATRSPPAPPQ